MNDQQAAMQLTVGVMIMIAIAIAVMVAGVVIALLAVTGFVLNEWRNIYRYEGKRPVRNLAILTAIVAVPCLAGALEQFHLFTVYLEYQSDQWIIHAFGAIIYIVVIAIPTGAYWLVRLVRPVSHVRIAVIEHWHDEYANANITKHERNENIAETIAMGDEALEKMVAASRRPPAQTIVQNHVFDVPEQN